MTSAANADGLSGMSHDSALTTAIQERLVLPVVCAVGLVLAISANWLFPGFGFVVCVLTASIALMLSTSRSMELLIFAFLFQNVTIAIIGGVIGTFDGAGVAKATNFLLCLSLWGLCLALYARIPAEQRENRIMVASLAVLGLIGLYFVYGLARNGSGAIIYLRNLIVPFACLHIGLCASRYSGGKVHYPTWIAVPFIIYCYLEMYFGADFMQVINANDYFSASAGAGAAGSTAEEGFAVPLFNTTLFGDLGTLHRLTGPNLHPISLAYAFATLALLCFIQKRYIQMLLFVPLFIFAGSKGSIAYFVLTAAGIFAASRINPRLVMWTAIAIACVYAFALYWVGIGAGDFHVLGLVGSLKGFMANPLGYGIGAGGNLNLTYTLEQWQTFQDQGFTEGALETAVGVLLYQMGIAGFAVLGFYMWLGRVFWKQYLVTSDPMHAFGAFATLFILTNSIFQEEALFSPLCFGLALLFAAAAYRPSDIGARATEPRA